MKAQNNTEYLPASSGRRTIIIIGAVSGWFALGTQLYLIILNREVSLGEIIVRYFSFFTILTNLLLALCYSYLWLAPATSVGRYFARFSVQSALLVYIIVVGLVYNMVLRSLWQPEGLQQLTDELLHVFTVVWYLLFWLVGVSKTRLAWKEAFIWLLYPLCYLILVVTRAAFSGFYPYPFLEIPTHGYGGVLVHCAVLFLVFLGLSLLVIGVARLRYKHKN